MNDKKNPMMDAAEEVKNSPGKYDQALKDACANRRVIALFWCIMLRMLFPKLKCTFSQVLQWRLSKPLIQTVPVDAGKTNVQTADGKVTFYNSENEETNEGKIVFDILDKLYTGLMLLISDDEFQQTIYLSYPVEDREYFYSERLVSSAKGRDFEHSDYEEIPDISSMWIILQPPKYQDNVLTVQNLAKPATAIYSKTPLTEEQKQKLEKLLKPTFKQVIIGVYTGNLTVEETSSENLEKIPDLLIFCDLMTGRLCQEAAVNCIDYLAQKYQMPLDDGKKVKDMLDMVQTFKNFYFDQGFAAGEAKIKRIQEQQAKEVQQADKKAELDTKEVLQADKKAELDTKEVLQADKKVAETVTRNL